MSPLQYLFAILGIGFLIAWHELGHYVVARLLGMRVLRYSLGFGPRLFGFRHQDIEYQVAALPFGGFVQIAGMSGLEDDAKDDPKSYSNAPRWARFLVLAAGPGFNYGVAALFFFLLFWMWPSPIAGPALEIVDVAPASAAFEAGIVPGDYVTGVNQAPLESDTQFREAIAKSNGQPLTLSVLREGTVREVTVTPKLDGEALRVGVTPAIRHPRLSFVETVGGSLVACVNESGRVLSALQALVYREPGVQVGGVVEIVRQLKDGVARGPRYFLGLLAMLSVNLGLLNLLPVPALDGSKMVVLAVEGTLRKNLHAKVQAVVHLGGFVVLFALMIGLAVKDVVG